MSMPAGRTTAGSQITAHDSIECQLIRLDLPVAAVDRPRPLRRGTEGVRTKA
jgi:hypothetical protein